MTGQIEFNFPQKQIEAKAILEKGNLKYQENNFEIAYGLHFLQTDLAIWDMRAWVKDHDNQEVKNWIEQETPDHKNSGHAGYCIQQLKLRGVSVDTIAKAILSNRNYTYRNRFAPCMLGAGLQGIIGGKETICPVYQHYKNFSHCDKCGDMNFLKEVNKNDNRQEQSSGVNSLF